MGPPVREGGMDKRYLSNTFYPFLLLLSPPRRNYHRAHDQRHEKN